MKTSPMKKLIFYFLFLSHFTEIYSQSSIKSNRITLGVDISSINLDFKADILYGVSGNYEKAFAKKWSLGVISKYLRYKIERECKTTQNCTLEFNKSMVSSLLFLNFYTNTVFEGFNLTFEIGYSKIWENYVNWKHSFLPLRGLYKANYLSMGLTMGYNFNLKTNWYLGFKGGSSLLLSNNDSPPATSLSCQVGLKF
jgi:hypothetical protein